jgi:hypothetical protein
MFRQLYYPQMLQPDGTNQLTGVNCYLVVVVKISLPATSQIKVQNWIMWEVRMKSAMLTAVAQAIVKMVEQICSCSVIKMIPAYVNNLGNINYAPVYA